MSLAVLNVYRHCII